MQQTARDVPAVNVPFDVSMSAPTTAQLGKEFEVQLSMPAGMDMRSGQMQLRYDPAALQIVGLNVVTPGIALITFDGQAPARAVRFRVIAPAKASTRIAIEDAEVVDGSGFAIGVSLPAAADIALAP